MQTYLKNGYIVSMDQQDTLFDGGGVLVEDDRITAVGKVDPRLVKPDAEVIDLQGKYVLPGFVNTHVHTSQQISRGVGDDVERQQIGHAEHQHRYKARYADNVHRQVCERRYILFLCEAAGELQPAFFRHVMPSLSFAARRGDSSLRAG